MNTCCYFSVFIGKGPLPASMQRRQPFKTGHPTSTRRAIYQNVNAQNWNVLKVITANRLVSRPGSQSQPCGAGIIGFITAHSR